MTDDDFFLKAKRKQFEGVTWEAYASVRYGESDRLERFLLELPPLGVMNLLEISIANENSEAVLLCEREIARRGLHVKDNGERFEL